MGVVHKIADFAASRNAIVRDRLSENIDFLIALSATIQSSLRLSERARMTADDVAFVRDVITKVDYAVISMQNLAKKYDAKPLPSQYEFAESMSEIRSKTSAFVNGSTATMVPVSVLSSINDHVDKIVEDYYYLPSERTWSQILSEMISGQKSSRDRR